MTGQFSANVRTAFERTPQLIGQVARSLLEVHIPESMHPAVLAAIGIELIPEPANTADVPTARRCDPRFRAEVGVAYGDRWGRERLFDHEPDFPAARTLFRDALECARASMDPPFDPPPEFPDYPSPHLCVEFWRSAERFPEVRAGLDWLTEMLARLVEGVPPVSEAEFAELAAWFDSNDDALRAQSSELLDVVRDLSRRCLPVCKSKWTFPLLRNSYLV